MRTQSSLGFTQARAIVGFDTIVPGGWAGYIDNVVVSE